MGGGSSKNGQVTVCSWNIAKGEGNLTKLLKTIPLSGRMVICLQEVNSACEAIIVAKFKAVVVRPGEPIPNAAKWYLLKPSNVQGWIYNLTLTNFCPTEIFSFNIPEEARHVMSVGIKMGRDTVFVYNVHLLSGRGEDKSTKRRQQIKSIYGKANKKGSKQIIVGDYNMAADEMKWPPKNYNAHQLVPTYSSDNPVNQNFGARTPQNGNENGYRFQHPFDRCMAKGLTVKSVKVIGPGKGTLSDHYGLAVVIGR